MNTYKKLILQMLKEADNEEHIKAIYWFVRRLLA